MSAALALILLAEAATSCTPAGEPQFAGGATIVRPVAQPEPLPVERLGPATRLTKSDAIHQAAADEQADEPQAGPAEEDKPVAEQCETPIHFV